MINYNQTKFHNDESRWVLTTEQMQDLLDAGRTTCMTYSNSEVFFFTDHYCLLSGLKQDRGLVPSSTVIPLSVASRPELPDGVIRSAKDYITVFEKGNRQITSLEELTQYLLEQQPT